MPDFVDIVVDGKPVSFEELRRIPRSIYKSLVEKYQINSTAIAQSGTIKDMDLRDRKAAMAQDTLFIDYIRRIRNGQIETSASSDTSVNESINIKAKELKTGFKISVLSENDKCLFTFSTQGELVTHNEAVMFVYPAQHSILLEPHTKILMRREGTLPTEQLLNVEYVFQHQGAVFVVGRTASYADCNVHYDESVAR